MSMRIQNTASNVKTATWELTPRPGGLDRFLVNGERLQLDEHEFLMVHIDGELPSGCTITMHGVNAAGDEAQLSDSRGGRICVTTSVSGIHVGLECAGGTAQAIWPETSLQPDARVRIVLDATKLSQSAQ